MGATMEPLFCLLLVGVADFLLHAGLKSPTQPLPKKAHRHLVLTTFTVLLLFFTGCATTESSTANSEKHLETVSTTGTSVQETIQDTASVQEKVDLEQEQAQTKETLKTLRSHLAELEYEGSQTIEINDNIPIFSSLDLVLDNGSWETYGDLDQLNRATSAEAMLNQDLMPTEKRGNISNVTPTGWKNKKIGNTYLYNRSHLIGFALAGENDNWKNLITGTAQLNNPEMLRHEMDVKYYLDQSEDNYVRYSVTPIFRGDELLARGVHLMAQSIDTDEISFNVYIFNVQDNVTLDYADGSSQIQADSNTLQETQYVDAEGNGTIKGSKNGIYHLPGSTYYNQTKNVVQWFKTVREAENAGYRAPKG